jgi:diguanylate cyclase (GGDEF)-like protein
MTDPIDKDDVPSGDRPISGPKEPVSIELLRGLLQLYTAQNPRALADALASLPASSDNDVTACAFLDDGSGLLTPLIGERKLLPGLSDVRLSSVQPGPVAEVFRRGEVIVSDSLEDIMGEGAPALPARRILLSPLTWEGESLGVVLFCDQGRELDLGLGLELAKHVSLALIRLRALNRTYRFGGIDPAHWMFDREWLHLRLAEEVERARRYGRPLALLLFGFENLDRLSQKAGRHQTEIFLRRVAAVIRGQVRTPDILAAYGEASIAVLLPETERDAAVATQRRIAERISQLKPSSADVNDWTPGLLTGAAAYPGDGDSAADLVAAAQSSMTGGDGEQRLRRTA